MARPSSLVLSIQDHFSVTPSKIIISLHCATFSTGTSLLNPITELFNCKILPNLFFFHFIVNPSLLKVKIFLCFIHYYAMREYGEVEVQLHSF
jgi:hypothetical protein